MDTPFLAMLMVFAGNFAPRGWALCQGQLLSINQNTALFSLLGTNFGGNGSTTFGLPDLRGRVPVGIGQGPGLVNVNVGDIGGSAQVTLNVNQMPTHSHLVNAVTDAGDSAVPTNSIWANTGALDREYKLAPTANFTNMSTTSIANTGGSQPIDIRNPYLGMVYCIALQGIFPSRN